MTSTRHPLHVFILDNGAYSIKAGWSALNEPIPFDPVALSSSVSSRSKPKSSKTKKKSSKKKGKKGSKNIRHQEDGELEAEEIEGEEEEILTPEEEYVKLYQAKIYPNAIARSKNEKRTYVADEVDACTDFAGMLYKRPFERVSPIDESYNSRSQYGINIPALTKNPFEPRTSASHTLYLWPLARALLSFRGCSPPGTLKK